MSDAQTVSQRVRNLLDRGVSLPCPNSVEIDDALDPQRIAPGVVIHAGCRIAGALTSIGPGSELGREAPVVIEDCRLGHNVQLKGGYFSGSTFLDGSGMGSSAHVRPATLLEEEASGAHAVGLKQTIFLSYVTAGSLVNFCDALMAGGTDRKNHSEIGSSYIHFNFTPHQDKATPSLIGDVPRGVFLDQLPVFLGGQGGIVGPARIAYGTVIPAGTICRRDILDEGTLYASPQQSGETRAITVGVYRGVNRIVKNNLVYIGNLWALREWYLQARIRTMSADAFTLACHSGALSCIEEGLKERITRLGELAAKMKISLKRARAETGGKLPDRLLAQQQTLLDRWPEIKTRLETPPPPEIDSENRDNFLEAWERADAALGHIKTVNSLSPSARKAGAAWLQRIVDSASNLWMNI